MKGDFKIRYNPQIYLDIQHQADYYFEKTGDNQLSIRFVKTIKSALKELKSTAYHYQIKYDNVRCLVIPVFPFMAHYRIDEDSKTVFVDAIFHTSEDPKKWTNS